MNIQKINRYSVLVPSRKLNSDHSKQSKPIMNVPKENDSISFKRNANSFKTLLEKYSFKNFPNVKEMQEGFTKLYEAVKTDKTIKKTPNFGLIDNLYQKGGFLGLLYELWKPNPGKEVKEIIKKSKDDYVLELAKIGNKEVFLLNNFGPYGFLNFIKENYNAKREMNLIFSHPEVENSRANFFIDKSGDFAFSNSNATMRYHSSTGTPKTETMLLGDKVEIIHYNKDGSKAFFKNWFFGGTQGPEDLVI